MSGRLLSPDDLIRFRACDLDRRISECDAAGWDRAAKRPLREWRRFATVPQVVWAMWRLDQECCGRVLAAVLDAARKATMPLDVRADTPDLVQLLREPARWPEVKQERWGPMARGVGKGFVSAAKFAVMALDRAQDGPPWEREAATAASLVIVQLRGLMGQGLDVEGIVFGVWEREDVKDESERREKT